MIFSSVVGPLPNVDEHPRAAALVLLRARPARRFAVIGADARGAAAVQHLRSTNGASSELLGLLDDDGFKHGKLFHGYQVLGSLDDLATNHSANTVRRKCYRTGNVVCRATGGARVVHGESSDSAESLLARRHRGERGRDYRSAAHGRLSALEFVRSMPV